MTIKIKLTALIFLFFFIIVPLVSAANFPLEITNIKPAGTGDPAIPATNRIFSAYPGIEYNIRAAVRGGVYPYTYSLSNAPTGMSIDSDTGEITWTNPQSDSGTITLTVTDSADTPNTVTADWSVTVTTTGFLFVDSSHTGTESGTLSEPYSSIQNLVDNTTDADWEKIVYFREGEYDLPAHNTGSIFLDRYGYGNFNAWGPDNARRPLNWIGYPGESVFIDCNYRSFRTSESFYVDNINFGRLRDYFVQTQGEENYMTIRRCHFWDLSTESDTDNNYGYLHTYRDETNPGDYLVIQDNVFSHWQSNSIMSGIGSLYNQEKAIIEDNYLHSSVESRYERGNLGISPKTSCLGITIRGNKVVMDNGTPVGENNSYFYNTDAEVCFNIFDKTNTNRWVHNWNQVSGSPQKDLLYWRNTTIGPETKYLYTPENPDGPFTYENNVVCVTYNDMFLADNPRVSYQNNLTGSQSDADTMLNDDYTLTSEYDSYRGTHGWEISGITKTWPDPVRQLPSAFSSNGYGFWIYDPGESSGSEVTGETDDADYSYVDGKHCYDVTIHGPAYRNIYADGTFASISKVEVKPEGGTYADAVDVIGIGDWSSWESDGKIRLCEGVNRIYFKVTDVDGNTSEKFKDITVYDNTTAEATAPWDLAINIVGSGSVTEEPDQTEYDDQTEVTLTASPDSGWEFDSWSGDLSGSINPETIVMDSDKSVTATFTEDATDTVSGAVSIGTGTGQIGVGSGSGSMGIE